MNDPRLQAFIDRYAGNGPERGATCDTGVETTVSGDGGWVITRCARGRRLKGDCSLRSRCQGVGRTPPRSLTPDHLLPITLGTLVRLDQFRPVVARAVDIRADRIDTHGVFGVGLQEPLDLEGIGHVA